MPSLRDIRKRIRSVNSTQKITRAMKMVAASKLRRAQEAVLAARPYTTAIAQLMARFAARIAQAPELEPHPLMGLRPEGRLRLIVVTSDRGGCGAFNTNVLRRADRFIHENAERLRGIEVVTWGRKGADHFRRRGDVVWRALPHVSGQAHTVDVEAVVADILGPYGAGRLDAVLLLYNAFVNALVQKVTLKDILPIVPEPVPEGTALDALLEPGQEDLVALGLPRYLAAQLRCAVLESAAAEQGARMTAMEAASKNARELSDDLTLQYNRARQAAITRELLDIVGGAEALRA